MLERYHVALVFNMFYFADVDDVWNISNYVPTKHHLRRVLHFFFNSKESAAESHRLLFETYGDYTQSIETREYRSPYVKGAIEDSDWKQFFEKCAKNHMGVNGCSPMHFREKKVEIRKK